MFPTKKKTGQLVLRRALLLLTLVIALPYIAHSQTASTHLTSSGMSASEAMKITGHTQMTTFQRYVNITEEAARNGAERLDALLNSQSRRNRSSNVLQLRRNN